MDNQARTLLTQNGFDLSLSPRLKPLLIIHHSLINLELITWLIRFSNNLLEKLSTIGQFNSLKELYMEDFEELYNSNCLIFASYYSIKLTLLNLSLEQIIATFNNNFNELRQFSFIYEKELDANELLCQMAKNIPESLETIWI
ncbi:10151_t:CDS:2 [Diversispora eburnea]|uniref:10151_t:CDS:1 n=1 Tax=Diversispora eburnea TaxID=1213867 RepID=A0A9N9FZM6_9GLOM|nr:10151_t:CDS:2 [Diversispora eburnea]